MPNQITVDQDNKKIKIEGYLSRNSKYKKYFTKSLIYKHIGTIVFIKVD